MSGFTQLLLAALCGIFAGIFTGLTPGIHVNLVTVLTVSFSPLLLAYTSPLALAAFIISLAITHSFLDALPSIYLGAPDAGQELNVLPGHRLLLRGEGHNAITCTLIGSLGSLLLGAALFPAFAWAMVILQPLVQRWIGAALILLMAYMALKEKGTSKKLRALLMVLLSGALGILVLNMPTLHEPLFHLLSGLFGFSLLLLSLNDNAAIPAQHNAPLQLGRTAMGKAVGASTSVGFIAAFLPGFGSSQAAILSTQVVGDLGDEGFLTLVGGINTANMLISIATAYTLGKARNGAILGVQDLLGEVTFHDALVFLAVSLTAAGTAVLLTLWLSRVFCNVLGKVDYQTLVLSILGFIATLSFYFDGWLGLLVLATSTALGLFAAQLHVGKNHLMGCLVIPVILFFML